MTPTRPHILITAGPTHEPIDQVRYIGNRSSGRMGISLFDASLERGNSTTLLLGPTNAPLSDARGMVERFQTAAELESLLAQHFPTCDILIMAAAVADYRPRPTTTPKIPRTNAPITLVLDPVPDLVAQCAARRQVGRQFIVGFALGPSTTIVSAAREKLERKRLDAIVANPIETMESGTIDPTILWASGDAVDSPGNMTKEQFAAWMIERTVARAAEGRSTDPAR